MRHRIVHLISGLCTGGAEVTLSRLLSAMDRDRFENVVISLTGRGTLGDRIESLGIRVYSIQGNCTHDITAIGTRQFVYIMFIGLWKLVWWLWRERPQILQTWLYHSDLLGLIAGKLAGVPVIVWNIRCTELKRPRRRMMWLLACLSAYPQAIVVNSFAGRVLHEGKGYHPKRWVHIPNGFDTRVFKPDTDARHKVRIELQISDDMVLIGLVARIDPLKDHGNFLQAAYRVAQDRNDVEFLLVGLGADDTNEQLVSQIQSLGLKDRVRLMGERRDIPQVMAALDILASPSLAEGFPNVVGEAMSCGIPCVVTDVGDSAWLVGDAGRVVPSRDSEAMALALNDLIEIGADGRSRLGEAARERIVRHFEITRIVRRYESCYEEMLSTALK